MVYKIKTVPTFFLIFLISVSISNCSDSKTVVSSKKQQEKKEDVLQVVRDFVRRNPYLCGLVAAVGLGTILIVSGERSKLRSEGAPPGSHRGIPDVILNNKEGVIQSVVAGVATTFGARSYGEKCNSEDNAKLAKEVSDRSKKLEEQSKGVSESADTTRRSTVGVLTASTAVKTQVFKAGEAAVGLQARIDTLSLKAGELGSGIQKCDEKLVKAQFDLKRHLEANKKLDQRFMAALYGINPDDIAQMQKRVGDISNGMITSSEVLRSELDGIQIGVKRLEERNRVNSDLIKMLAAGGTTGGTK